MKNRIYKIPVYILTFILILSAAGCSSAAKVSVMPTMKTNSDFKPKERKLIEAETRTLDKLLGVSAMVSCDEAQDLSFKIDYCNLKAIYVSKNDKVEEGQLLAELDASDLEYRIAERQIDLKKVQLMYDRVESNTGMDSADKNTQLESLNLDMESINKDIDYIKELIEKTQLRAPFSGVITDIKSVTPGTTVAAYDKFMSIWKPGSIVLISEVLNPYGNSDNIDYSGITAGMNVSIVYGSRDNETVIPATITKIVSMDPGVQADPNRILSAPAPFQIYVKPDGDYSDTLYVDHSVVVRINTGTLENVVVLPKTAIRGFGNDFTVKVLMGEKVITRRITTGYTENKEGIVVITSGLRPGESVVVN